MGHTSESPVRALDKDTKACSARRAQMAGKCGRKEILTVSGKIRTYGIRIFEFQNENGYRDVR